MNSIKQTVIALFMLLNLSVEGQNQYYEWDVSPHALPKSGEWSDVGAFTSPTIAPCGVRTLTATNAQFDFRNGVGWIAPLFDNVMNGWRNFNARFNRTGWNFLSQSYHGGLFDLGNCDIRNHPIYIYDSYLSTNQGLTDWSRFSVSGNICGTSNTNIVLNMQDPNPLYKYKIDVVEVNSANGIVPNGYNWSSGWRKNFDKYIPDYSNPPAPLYDNSFRLVPSNSTITGKNVFSGVNVQQGKRYKITLSHEYPFNLPIPSISNVTSTTNYIYCCAYPPTNLKVTGKTTTAATLNWATVSGASNYRVRYKVSTATNWTTITTPNTSYSLTGLTPNLTYNWQVEAICLSGSTGYSGSSFITAPDCTDMYEANNTKNTAYLLTSTMFNRPFKAMLNSNTDVDWFRFTTSSASPSFEIDLTDLPYNYDMELWRDNTLIATSRNTGTNDEFLANGTFRNAATYYIKVHGNGIASSAFSCYSLKVSKVIDGLEPRSALPKVEEVDAVVQLEQNAPNPFATTTDIRYSIPQAFDAAQLVVRDISGRIMTTVSLTEHESIVTLNAKDLSNGYFTYSLIVDGRIFNTKKLVIQK